VQARGLSVPHEPAVATIQATLVLPVVALALWSFAIARVDPRAMNDLGLVSVFPPMAFAALVLLLVSYGLALRQQNLSRVVLMIHIGVLIWMLYGATLVVEEVPRFAISYRHVGLAEYISRNHAVDPLIDAYHSWPGFFALSALLSESAGLNNGIALTPWAPVFFNLLYLGPLMLIMRAATTDERVVWLAIWFFYLTDWIGQDYYAPQALAFFFYLFVIGVLLTWFRDPQATLQTGLKWLDERAAQLEIDVADRDRTSDLTGSQRVLLLGVVMLVLGAMVSSHQLTPFFTLGSAAALVALRRVRTRGLPLLVVVLIAAWAAFPAVAFFQGHLVSLIAEAGQSGAIEANVTSRMTGSPEHIFIVWLRLVFTVLVWGLAGLGMLRRLRAGYLDLSLIALAAAPFPFLVLQPYGGEMLLRVYLFMLAPVAFFAASALIPRAGVPIGWWTTGAATGISVVLMVGFLFARYGNERMDFYTRNELSAVEYLYDLAQPALQSVAQPNTQKPLVVVASYNMPWRYRDDEHFEFLQAKPWSTQSSLTGRTAFVDELAQAMREPQRPAAYLILTRSAAAELTLMQGLPQESMDLFKQDLGRSGEFRLIYQNADAALYTLAAKVEEPVDPQ